MLLPCCLSNNDHGIVFRQLLQLQRAQELYRRYTDCGSFAEAEAKWQELMGQWRRAHPLCSSRVNIEEHRVRIGGKVHFTGRTALDLLEEGGGSGGPCVWGGTEGGR